MIIEAQRANGDPALFTETDILSARGTATVPPGLDGWTDHGRCSVHRGHSSHRLFQ